MSVNTQYGGQRHLGMIAVAFGLISLCCCAPQTEILKAHVGPTPDLEKKAAAADGFFKKGCYVGFKKAIAIYDELYFQPAIKIRILVPYIKALVLMSVREKELGILDDKYIQRTREVIKENPSLQSFAPYIELADGMYPKTKGIMKDIDVMATVKIVNDYLKNPKLSAEMKLKAFSDDYFAYLYSSFCLSYANYLDPKEYLSGIMSLYPNSVLFEYKNAATYPHQDPKRLEALAQAEPEFYEAYFHLGELAVGSDKPIDMDKDFLKPFDAEKYFLKAFEGIPESPQVTIYLGAIYMAEEEYDKSLDYYERTISLVPVYRDALLGKASCLSYMGRNYEAIEILNKLVAMGFYLIGESNYWLAWNYHELKDNEKARLRIEESERLLPTDSEVFGLAGTIALENNDLKAAEKDFIESIRFNGRNINAILGLGQVYAQEQKWLESASFYSSAAKLALQRENELTEFLNQIEKSALVKERKVILIAKKEQKIKNLEATEAASYYNASTGFFKAGQKRQALEMALKAAVHPEYKEMAEKLIKQIK
jgi:tetratricopeptide (TPR) repeat protein